MTKENINVIILHRSSSFMENESILIRFNEDLNVRLGDEIIIETNIGYGGAILTAYIIRKETNGEKE